MTLKEKENYNKMLSILKRIGKDYQTPDQLRKNSEKDFGLEYEEALEMAYENIQEESKFCIKGLTPIK